MLQLRAQKSGEQIEQLCLRIVQLERDVQQAHEKEQSMASFTANRKQYEEKVSILSHEIERLNVLVESKTVAIYSLETELQESKNETARLMIQLGESNRKA